MPKETIQINPSTKKDILLSELREVDARIVENEEVIVSGSCSEEEIRIRRDMLDLFRKRKSEVQAQILELER